MSNICLVGFSSAGGAHLLTYGAIHNARVTCIVKQHQMDFDGPKIYYSLQEALEKCPVDIVDICTPVETHYEIAKQALAANKSVIIEKPITLDPSQLNDLHKMAIVHKCHIYECAQLKYLPVPFWESFDEMQNEHGTLIATFPTCEPLESAITDINFHYLSFIIAKHDLHPQVTLEKPDDDTLIINYNFRHSHYIFILLRSNSSHTEQFYCKDEHHFIDLNLPRHQLTADSRTIATDSDSCLRRELAAFSSGLCFSNIRRSTYYTIDTINTLLEIYKNL